jgi:cytosine/adenosine deaminase-related metal-dependent hydrolase
MIIRSRVVAPMAGEPIDDGAVVVEGNKIAGIGRLADMRRGYSGEVLDLGEQILLPGLINAHCHLDYTILRDKIGPQQSFADWIGGINTAKAALSENDYVESIEAGLAEAGQHGTTTLLNLEAFPELLPRLSRPLLRVWWCAEMIDVRKPVEARKVFDSLHDSFRAHPDWLGGVGLAPHALYTASRELYSEASEVARKEGVPFTTHLAESSEEMKMFRDASGPAYDFLKSIRRPMEDCGHETPLSLMMRTQSIREDWIVAHLNELGDGDFDLLARAPKFQIVHCPRSHSFFGHAPFALPRLRKLGFNICLGTDSLASNSSLSLFAEMRELLRKETGLAPRDVLEMVTIHAAAALGEESRLGQISPGFYADLIAIPYEPARANLFEHIIAFEQTVPWRMVNGHVIGSGA